MLGRPCARSIVFQGSLETGAITFPLWGPSTCFHFFFLFFNLATPHGLWDLSSPTRDQTRAPAVKVLSPNHWTTREFPSISFLSSVREFLQVLIQVSTRT